MRSKRDQPFDFPLIASLCVIVFCLQLATLLFVACIAFAPTSPSDRLDHPRGAVVAGRT